MDIKNLYLENFKVFLDAHIQIKQKKIVIAGSNGYGKTSLLEAIHTFLSAYSFGRQKDKDLLSYKTSRYTLMGDIKTVKNHHSLFLKYEANHKKKQFSLDGQSITKYKSLLELFPLVCFTPLDIQNILGEPNFRRLFFDRMISYLKPDYYTALKQYKKILRERNSLLKMKDYALMEMWNDKFFKMGSFIIDTRQKVLKLWNEYQNKNILPLPSFLKGLRWIYKGSENGEKLEQIVLQNHYKEKLAQTTLYGPHRDDYIILGNNEKEVKSYFSLGQIKWLAFYMKCLEIIIMNQYLPSPPIFLVDDIFSELDKNNRASVIPIWDELPNQIWSTITDIDFIPPSWKDSVDFLFLESEGKISQRIL